MRAQPLKGIKVIDISSAYAGPYCSMLLADMGAEVIKIEKPGEGDPCRTWGPPFIKNESAWFLSVNRNKKSVAIDIFKPEGKELLDDLLKDADVFIENLKPSSIPKFGLAYEQVKKINDQIVYCAISGYGHTGPLKNEPGYDLIAQAMSGLMSVTGESNGRPQRVGTAITDIVTGMISAYGIVSGLFQRTITGEGLFIDTALLDTDLALMAPRITSYLASGEEPIRSGGTDSVITIYQALRTADEDIVVATGTSGIWKRFCTAINQPELIDNPDYCTNEKRKENQSNLIDFVEQILIQHESKYWLQKFSEMKIPAAAILKVSDVVQLPQALAREMIIGMNHPVAGNVKIVGSPIAINGDKVEIKPSPLLGQNTNEVLTDLGVPEYRLKELEKIGVIELYEENLNQQVK
ncbi:CoA transferase [Neobacillus sp. YX16]|uniref:CaiB/BaiF CoA transferase family protein n=1 Tax=Neobacillus sp. YX16 TaxID=3047874 RepID=UPI0024C30372|nr:CoA transferase [Neobacillus sp. YX16]WHZ00885.1 CoA transferase [Neobacillus sp. YX16]